MQRDKVSEKVIWENYNPSDDSISITAHAESFKQPQMVFCWKCGKSIPLNSTFCPWCQTELYTKCPKCGERYSSEYPSCYKCGTNKEMFLLEQTKKKEELERERIKQEEEKLIKERYQIARKKIEYASSRYVYKVYHVDAEGKEIVMILRLRNGEYNGEYLGQWYEDAHGTRISNMFNKIFDNHRFSCGCVEKNNKWAAVRFTSDNSTSKGAISVTRITSFDFDTPFVFEQMVIDSKSLIAANVKLNNKSYVLTQEGALLEREDIFRREQTGEKIIKNKERVKTLIYTLIMLVLLWIVAIVLENLTPDDLGMIWVGLILTAIFIIVMIGNWIMTPSSFVEPIYVNNHFVTYKLMKQYIVESLK